MALSYREDDLTVELSEQGNSVMVAFSGKSVSREPGRFMTPILQEALKRALNGGQRVQLDFRALQYMNSSTVTPAIRFLETVKKGEGAVTVRYDSSLKWQSLSFSALFLFQTSDGRIQITGS